MQQKLVKRETSFDLQGHLEATYYCATNLVFEFPFSSYRGL